MLRNLPSRAGVLAALLLLLGLRPLSLAAAEPEVPARWPLPPRPIVVVQVEQPTKFVKHLLRYAALPELARFPAYREFLDSTAQRRFLQFLGYLQHELGGPPEEMLDRLAGRGIVFTIESHLEHPFAKPEPRATLWLRGKDADFTERAVAVLTEIGTQELARQESKDKYEYEGFQGVKITKLSDKFAFAVVGADVIVSNHPAAVKAAIARSKRPSAVPEPVVAARARLAGEPLAWLWTDLKQAKARAGDGFKKALELPTNDFVAHIALGGWFDVIRRSDELTVALNAEGEDLILATCLPAGHEGMSPAMKAVFAKPLDEPGPRPFTNVTGALYQSSFWYRPHGFIENLDKFVTENVRKEFTDFEKKTRLVLLGRKFGDLVGLLGGRHELIVARQRETGYQTVPRDRYPAFGIVFELADPEKFEKQAMPLVRAGGFLASFNVSMKLAEEKVGEHKLVGYRFTENAKNKENNHGVLFNFSPCLVRVGDRLIACSTFELARDLLPLVKENGLKGSYQEEASSRYRFTWTGLGYYLDGLKGQVLSSIILSDGSSFEEAEKQAADLKRLFERLGSVEAAVFYGKDEFKLELRTRLNDSQAARNGLSEPRTK